MDRKPLSSNDPANCSRWQGWRYRAAPWGHMVLGTVPNAILAEHLASPPHIQGANGHTFWCYDLDKNSHNSFIQPTPCLVSCSQQSQDRHQVMSVCTHQYRPHITSTEWQPLTLCNMLLLLLILAAQTVCAYAPQRDCTKLVANQTMSHCCNSTTPRKLLEGNCADCTKVALLNSNIPWPLAQLAFGAAPTQQTTDTASQPTTAAQPLDQRALRFAAAYLSTAAVAATRLLIHADLLGAVAGFTAARAVGPSCRAAAEVTTAVAAAGMADS